MLKKSMKIQQKLVKVAIEILREKGNVTLTDIATRAACNIAAVNYHFKDKATFNRVIILDVFDEVIEWAKVTEKVSNCTTSEDTIKIVVESTVQFIEHNIGVFRYMFALSDVGESDCTMVDVIIEKFDELVKIVARNLVDIMPSLSYEQMEVKYSMMFSSYIMPLIFRMSATNKGRYFSNAKECTAQMIRFLSVSAENN